MIVPIVFNYESKKEELISKWIFDLYSDFCLKHDFPIIAQEMYFDTLSNDTKEKLKSYPITNSSTKKILNNFSTKIDVLVDYVSKENQSLINVLEVIIKKIILTNKIDAFLVWKSSPSIENVAKKYGIKVILSELSPIRKVGYSPYNVELAYFQFEDKYNENYCKNLYNQFLKEIKDEPVILYERRELLAMILKTSKLDIIQKMNYPAQFELGISPGLAKDKDEFFKSFSKETIDTTIKKTKKLFREKEVSIRFHPRFTYEIPEKFTIDDSETALDWIVKCRRVITSVSNVGFETMLVGRTAYILSDKFPFSFIAEQEFLKREESVVSTKFLNFILFCYFVPYEKMLDIEYINYRLTNPSLIELYKYHQAIILTNLKLNETDRFVDMLKKLHNFRDMELKKFIQEANIYEMLESKKQNFNLQEDKICKLEIQLQEKSSIVRKYQEDVLGYENSMSWKITRPLRYVMKKIKSIRK